MVVAITIGQALPPAGFWDAQPAYERILGFTPRLLAASFAAFLVGEFANSMILARLKVATAGRHLWLRTIGSTLIGEGLDSAIFITTAFAGILPSGDLVSTILTQWTLKVLYEVAVTPLTDLVVNAHKRAEGRDPFDRETSLNPVLVGE
jgi:uncharacterized integral membrane protein (TIGR00697 family)